MRIDAHQHFWQLDKGGYDWLTPELDLIYRDFSFQDLAPLLDAHQIAGSVLVQAADNSAETQYLLQLAAQQSRILAVVGWVDFAAHNVQEQISALTLRPKLRGLRPMIQDISDIDWMLRPELNDAFEAMIENDLCFDALVLPQHLANLRRLIDRYPNIKVVVDHAAKPAIASQKFQPWAEDITAIAENSNVYCKLSGLVTEANENWQVDNLKPYTDHLLDTFSPDYLIWGSDWPVLNLAADYSRWVECTEQLLKALSPQQRAKIYGENAIKFYQLNTKEIL